MGCAAGGQGKGEEVVGGGWWAWGGDRKINGPTCWEKLALIVRHGRGLQLSIIWKRYLSTSFDNKAKMDEEDPCHRHFSLLSPSTSLPQHSIFSKLVGENVTSEGGHSYPAVHLPSSSATEGHHLRSSPQKEATSVRILQCRPHTPEFYTKNFYSKGGDHCIVCKALIS